jgi:uncharacterized membrane protein
MDVSEPSRQSPDNKHNYWWLIGVCMIGIMITSLWMAYTPEGYLNKVDAIGYAVCHRISSHSFHMDGRPLPLCARCSGMYLGALFGLVYQLITGKRSGGFSRKVLTGLCLMALFFIIDGLNSFIGVIFDRSPLYTPQNSIRLITGLIVGILIAAVLYPIFTQTVWQNWQLRSALDRRWSIPTLLAGSFLLTAGMLSGQPYILYPLAILSVVGVVTIITVIYAIILLMIFKHENRYNHCVELTPALLGGMVLMMLQIGIFDLVRYLLTETWSGLPL